MGYQDRPAEPDVVGFGTERPPRRPWVTGALLAVAVGVVAAVVVSHSTGHHGRHGPKPGSAIQQPQIMVTYTHQHLLGVSAGWDLFARGFNYLVRIQLASGTITRTVVPPLESNNPEVALIVGPSEVIVRSFDDVPGYVVHDGDPAWPLTGNLAADSPGPLLPGPDPSQAWTLVSGPGRQKLLLVGLTGKSTRTSIQLPAGAVAATAISDGRGYAMLLTSTNHIYDAGPTWNRVVPSLVIAIGPTRWLSLVCHQQHCRNVVINAVSGARRMLPGPPLQVSAFAWPTLGVISPDGADAAVPVFAPNDSGGSVTVRLVNLSTGASRPLDVAMDPQPGYQIMAWSPDSRWLFIAASGGRLVAVNARTGQATGFGVSLPPVDQVAIRNASG